MVAVNTATEFLWGTPDEVGARMRPDVPSFRLVNPAGDLPPAMREFVVTPMPSAPVELKLDPPAKPLVRNGRTVGCGWEASRAVDCSLIVGAEYLAVVDIIQVLGVLLAQCHVVAVQNGVGFDGPHERV